MENASNTYSAFSSVKFDLEDDHDQYLLYSQFIVWYCNWLSIVPLTGYVNNKMYKELPRFEEYFSNSDEKLFIDLRRSKVYTNGLENLIRNDCDITLAINFKNATAQKIRLEVTGYYQGEYFYSLSNEDLIMNYKDYSINKQKTLLVRCC